jgi:hypothetical protein
MIGINEELKATEAAMAVLSTKWCTWSGLSRDSPYRVC